jgi:tetratricopeptide (TPR) repeat protein
MLSETYEDWLQAWELIRDHMPASVTTFDALDELFDLDSHECSINDMLYELDSELYTAGLDDPRLPAKRAEVLRWVYTNFPEENALNLGNFRGYEAEALWDLGQKDQAETLFQTLTETYPNFAWGYIWWGDQYWRSDWSYEHAPDYDRAEALYRQALSNPGLDDRRQVQDRLDELSDEQGHPEKRERIKQSRLKHIQRMKNVE